MLGPFYDRRTGAKISPEKWAALVSDPDYSDVAADRFPALGVIVKTRWLGHDREDSSPPLMFATKAMGDPRVDEINSATEQEALQVHEEMCARYKEQVTLLQGGSPPLLTDGVL